MYQILVPSSTFNPTTNPFFLLLVFAKIFVLNDRKMALNIIRSKALQIYSTSLPESRILICLALRAASSDLQTILRKEQFGIPFPRHLQFFIFLLATMLNAILRNASGISKFAESKFCVDCHRYYRSYNIY